ncbi:MAG: hypothetical protein JST76_12215 [Bacteroidetes bacterium]|nr:hypothetical protein [Bacteroidota bacterium]
MTLNDYLKETEFASTKLLEAVWEDFDKAELMRAQIQEQAKVVDQEYNAAVAMQQYAEDPDDLMAGVGRYWENYFGADKEVYHRKDALAQLALRLAAREFSLTTLCGNLLEHAKKGLSLVYGHPRGWPAGRAVGTQGLSSVIIEARNQSTHIDEAIRAGAFGKADVGKCFTALAHEIDPLFGDFLKRDMSFEVIKALGWRDFAVYRADMLTIV